MRAACTSQNPWRACRPPHFHVLDSANPDAPGATFYRYVLDRQRRRARRMEMSKLGRRTRLIRFMSTACGPHPTDRPTTDSARAHLPARRHCRPIFGQFLYNAPGVDRAGRVKVPRLSILKYASVRAKVILTVFT